jgi:hypothetical protein
MTKYEPLKEFLIARQHSPRVEMTFAQVEEVLGQRLPPSAYKHREWWANQSDTTNRQWAAAWLEAGFEVGTLHQNMTDGKVEFVRSVAKNSAGEHEIPLQRNSLSCGSPEGPAALLKLATELNDSGYFEPASLTDERKKILRQIVERRGQPEFRRKLIVAYAGCCAITGCDAVEALEAAHIISYKGPLSHHVTNGLLLRSDIHTLFDLDLIGINPETLTISVAPGIKANDYTQLHGRRVIFPDNATNAPNVEALRERWKRFCETETREL